MTGDILFVVSLYNPISYVIVYDTRYFYDEFHNRLCAAICVTNTITNNL